MLKKALIASLICLGGLFSSSAAPTLGGPTLSATGGSTNSSSGGVDTNAVIALIEQYGGGGGVVSNTVVQLTVDTWYTNGQYPVVVEAQIELPNSAALMLFSVKDTNSAVIGYLPGSAAWNEFGNASKYAFATTTATEDNVQSLGGYVPAYAAFRYYASGTTASIYDNAPNGTRLVYFGSGGGTNSSSGGGVTAAQVVAIMVTNLAKASTNLYDAKGVYGSQPLLRVYEDNDGQFYGPTLIGGHPQNYVAPGQPGSTVFGGITNTSSGAAYTNAIFDRLATIAGGVGSIIADGAEASFIGAGEQINIGQDSTHAVIVGGEVNTIMDLGEWAFIGGGYHNTLLTGSGYSVLVGGYDNTNFGSWNFLGGGEYIKASGNSVVIGGGSQNAASNNYAAILGGYSNTVTGVGGMAIGSKLTVANNEEIKIGSGIRAMIVSSNGNASIQATAYANNFNASNSVSGTTVSASSSMSAPSFVALPSSTSYGDTAIVYSGSGAFEFDSLEGVNFSGPVTASPFRGSGASLTNLPATNLVAFQASVFPTNAIPPGSTTVTNIGLVPWRGKLVFVATNRAVGGWMWQTNGPSGAPVWGAFNPATQP